MRDSGAEEEEGGGREEDGPSKRSMVSELR
jgi:hypothetical protein